MYELVAVVLVVALTWLVTLNMWLSGSKKAAQTWKARYMTVQRELKKLQQGGREAGSEADRDMISEVLSALGIQADEELISAIEEAGIPKEILGFALKNPDIVKAFLNEFMAPQTKQTDENYINAEMRV